jgi:hypothetical protein
MGGLSCQATLSIGMQIHHGEGPDGQPPGDARPRCVACRDVIGVYEPLVHLLDGFARTTSRAADPGVSSAAGEHFHLDCYRLWPTRRRRDG